MKISSWFIIAHFLGILIFFLAPVYDSMGLGFTYPRETAYLGWAMFFPIYLLMKALENTDKTSKSKEEGK